MPHDISLLKPSQTLQFSDKSGSRLVNVTKKLPGLSSSAFLERLCISSCEKQVELANMNEASDQSNSRKSPFITSKTGVVMIKGTKLLEVDKNF